MRKSALGGLLAAAMLVLATGSASAGTLRDCVIEKASAELNEAQVALLMAHGDGEINILSTLNDNHLDIGDSIKVHAAMTSAGLACLAGK